MVMRGRDAEVDDIRSNNTIPLHRPINEQESRMLSRLEE